MVCSWDPACQRSLCRLHPHQLGSVKHIRSPLQPASSLPMCQLSEPSGMDGLTSPAETQLLCYIDHLLVCLVRAAQGAWRRRRNHSFSCAGPCTSMGKGKGGSHSLIYRQDQGNPQGKGSCHQHNRLSPAFPPGLGTPSAGCVPKLVSLSMLYRSRRDSSVSVLLRSSLPLPCDSGHKTRGQQLDKGAAALPRHPAQRGLAVWSVAVRTKSCQPAAPER